MNFRAGISIFATLIFISVSCSQNRKKNNSASISHKAENKRNSNLADIDYLNKKYKYLDRNFKINIDSTTFNFINKDKMHADNYKDSLVIILSHELQNDKAVNLAFHRILYKWKRVGIYIWEDQETAEKIALEHGFNHPYKFIAYLNNDSIHDSKRKSFLLQLKDKVEKSTKRNLDGYKSEDFLDFAFRQNPIRIEEINKHKKEGHIH